MDYSIIYDETISLLEEAENIRLYQPKEQEIILSLTRLKKSLDEYFKGQNERCKHISIAEAIKILHEKEKIKQTLLQSFPHSFFNPENEFIVHKYSNLYISLEDCLTRINIQCKVLEWLSGPTCKGEPYQQKWRNQKFREYLMSGINEFLNTEFTKSDIEKINTTLGNAIDHQRTVRFVESGFDFEAKIR